MPHSPLLLQLVIILGTARVLALLLRHLGPPPVIGEMAASHGCSRCTWSWPLPQP